MSPSIAWPTRIRLLRFFFSAPVFLREKHTDYNSQSVQGVTNDSSISSAPERKTTKPHMRLLGNREDHTTHSSQLRSSTGLQQLRNATTHVWTHANLVTSGHVSTCSTNLNTTNPFPPSSDGLGPCSTERAPRLYQLAIRGGPGGGYQSHVIWSCGTRMWRARQLARRLRLHQTRDASSARAEAGGGIDSIRNCGIIAHIDAGELPCQAPLT